MTLRAAMIVVCFVSLWGTVSAEAGQVAQSTAATDEVKQEDLLATPVGKNWTSYNGDYSGRRFSSLRQIDRSNIGQLRLAWTFHPGNSQSLEATPLVVNGMMYVTAANDVFAIDARSGRTVWHYQRQVSSGLLDDAAAHKNRGVAVWKTWVYTETDDAHLLCLDARSGGLRWEIEYADKTKHYGATSAPLVVKDTVIVGTSGGDSGVRGFLAAYEAATGKLKWKFWTIPGPGEFGSSSWPGDAYLHGGGTTWMPGTFDPELNTLFWTTSNPAPDFVGGPRPGDDLYTDCVLALNPDTGELKWYFQFTPHDLYDYDANETPVLADINEGGSTRHFLLQANRNGFFYVLDRTDGKFLRAGPFLEKINWASGVDSSGRPILTGRIPSAEGTDVCPGIDGATNWFSPSYDPETRLFYVMSLENCNVYFANPKPFAKGQTYYDTGTKLPAGERSQKILLALSASDGNVAWRYPQVGSGDSWGGILTTAGGLLFFGDDAGEFESVDATSGQPLWHFNASQKMRASPMTYEVDGTQYVAIAAGSDVLSFALPHN